MSLYILKFGGAAVATPEHFSLCAKIIQEQLREGNTLVVVVSAMKGATDQLLDLALKVNPQPPSRETDMLISVGERISMSLLAMALHKEGISAISFTGSQSGIITSSDHKNARIIDVNPRRILPHLQEGKVVIVAGFQGVSREGEITTLGRGGSDTTAVALGVALSAREVRFYKDVGAVYDCDPKNFPQAAALEELTYDEALKIVNSGARILHDRCLYLAKENGLPLFVTGFESHHKRVEGSRIFESCIKVSLEKTYEGKSFREV